MNVALPEHIRHVAVEGVIGVGKTPGNTALTRMLSGASSRANAFVRPSMPALAAT